jgi:hypothetical protein
VRPSGLFNERFAAFETAEVDIKVVFVQRALLQRAVQIYVENIVVYFCLRFKEAFSHLLK